MFAFLHLTVVLLFAVLGYGIPKSEVSFYQRVSAVSSQEPAQNQVKAEFSERGHRQVPDLPEEVPVNEAEKEESSDEKERADGESFFLHLLAYKFALSHASSTYTHYLASSYVQASVPLYVLFHCWKNYLI